METTTKPRVWDDEQAMERVAALAEERADLLAGRLAAFRRQQGMSIDDLAAYLGVSRLQLFRIATMPEPKYVFGISIICRTWGGNPERLAEALWGEAPPPVNPPPPEHGGKEAH